MSFLHRIMDMKSKAHFLAPQSQTRRMAHAEFDGIRKRTKGQTRNRVALVMAGFTALYGLVGARLVQYGMSQPEIVSSIGPSDSLMASRPDLLDRNGQVLATDIRTVSLYAEPNKIIDPDEAVEQLASVLPNLDTKTAYRRLSSNSRFQWLQRQLTPKQQSQILSLGIPGIGFRPEKRL